MANRRIRSLIGLDVGTRAVKAVELTWSGGLVITGYGYAPVAGPDDVAVAVRRVLEENAFHTREVVTSVSGKSVVVRQFPMVRMDADALVGAIRLDADKYIPFDPDDCVMDAQPVEGAAAADVPAHEMRVLLVACKRALIAEHVRVLLDAGLQPQAVDVDVFAIAHAFDTTAGAADGGDRVRALVDVGASKTCVNVLCRGESLFSREIHAGGDAFTAAIASRLALPEAEAEALKRAPGPDLDRVRGAVAPALDDLATEVRLSFEYVENQFDHPVDEVLVSGGGARLAGVVEDLARAVDRPAQAWDPTGELPIAAHSVDSAALHEHAGELAVAVGLASRVRGESS